MPKAAQPLPKPKTLRDEFAIAFINGVATYHGALNDDDINDAYRVADRALLERDK